MNIILELFSNLDLAYLNLFVQTKSFGCSRYQFFFTVCIPIACFSFTLGATSDDLTQVCKKSAIKSLFDKLVLQNQHHNCSIPLMVPLCFPVLLLVFNVQHNGNRRGVEGSPTNYIIFKRYNIYKRYFLSQGHISHHWIFPMLHYKFDYRNVIIKLLIINGTNCVKICIFCFLQVRLHDEEKPSTVGKMKTGKLPASKKKSSRSESEPRSNQEQLIQPALEKVCYLLCNIGRQAIYVRLCIFELIYRFSQG